MDCMLIDKPKSVEGSNIMRKQQLKGTWMLLLTLATYTRKES